ncbi:flagellar brake protein [Clostridium felsineum]|uniref:Uncharacterized protein n=1 Tax=Clostridium felsineum TaxID=36839 RepID=A0A1S8MDF2_9CLOT|nr:flagellar brake domain-containing protein [Clostridium felsineum]URZ06349.1 hypothetical protein CLROS_016820 [Clostridium felsineum]URZ11384.1 hypothetical protein CROST_021010 [Clostridium felsineum]
MSDLGFIAINDKCEIVVDDEIYKSNIQGIEDKYIAISMPINNGTYAIMHKGDMAEVWCYHNKQVYSFTATVIDRKKEDKIKLVLISKPNSKDVKRVQRRRNFRVELIENIRYKILNKSVAEEEAKELKNGSVQELSNGYMVDLSGGGLKIRIKEKPNIGDSIFVNLPIGDEKVFLISTCVRAIGELNGEYLCGLEFDDDVDEKVREHIINYTFNIMRKHMKKG